MDVATRRGGDWLIVELGDRQVAGLLDEPNVRALYTALRDTLDDAGGRPVQDRRATDCCTWRRTQPARFYPRPYPPGVTTTAGSNAFDQGSFLARFDWGEAGLDTLSRGADVVVLVDVLSFTTAVDVGVSRGANVYPCHVRDATPAAFAQQLGAVLAVDRRHASPEQPFSLSPRSLATLPAGTRLVLPSPNGSALTLLAADHHGVVLAGCLRNAHAVAVAAQQLGGTVAIIAAGEHRPDGTLRFALEDLVGAGAILSHFASDARSPEAEVAVAGFQHLVADLARHLRACASGRELAALGFVDDVTLAAELDVSDAVPIFKRGAYTPHAGA